MVPRTSGNFFLQHSRVTAANLCQAKTQVTSPAHAMGAAGNVGAVALQSLSVSMEALAKTGVVPHHSLQDLDNLKQNWAKTNAVLDAWLA